MKLKNWYTTQELSDICKISTRTLERRRDKLLEENPELDWFKMKSRPYKYNFKMMEQFTSPELFDLIQRNRSLSNTIECMHRNDTLEQHLSFLNWDYFVTVTYEEPKSKMECVSFMNELYFETESKSSGDTRMFFTTETYSVSKGNHNHFVLKSDLKLYQVKELIEELEPVGIIDVQRYDYELAAIFYICKEMDRNNSGLYWGLLGNNLEGDGINIKHIKDGANI
ncbi:hypothetical protein [uncultured Winogradskyella sp.]|uniref:hypothetical protein n=1 Tax=uncultured Winogradskyella sp. TaxID=395353 RepID=UPI0026169D41|nr:hypothetical protein [uncultured Winogradskyella sp.]